MLKSTGGSEQGHQPPRRSIDIPLVDFGPTINYAQNTLPPGQGGPTRAFNFNAPPNAQREGSPRRKTPDAQYRPSEHQRNQSRQMAWQPGMPPPAADAVATRAMTAEEFVQQRAQAAAQRPQYAHQRQKSSANGNGNGGRGYWGEA